jgi:hypothetical protein
MALRLAAILYLGLMFGVPKGSYDQGRNIRSTAIANGRVVQGAVMTEVIFGPPLSVRRGQSGVAPASNSSASVVPRTRAMTEKREAASSRAALYESRRDGPVASATGPFSGAPSMGALLWVEVPSWVDHNERSEASRSLQLRHVRFTTATFPETGRRMDQCLGLIRIAISVMSGVFAIAGWVPVRCRPKRTRGLLYMSSMTMRRCAVRWKACSIQWGCRLKPARRRGTFSPGVFQIGRDDALSSAA